MGFGLGGSQPAPQFEPFLPGAAGRYAPAVVHPEAFPTVRDPTQVMEVAPVTGSLGRSEVRGAHEVTDTESLLAHQEPEDFQAGLIPQGFKKSSFDFPDYLITA